MATGELPQIRDMWDFNDPAASESAFRDAMTVARQAGDSLYEMELLTQVARTYGLRQQFAKGHAALDQVQKRLPAKSSLLHVRYFLERGRCFNSDNKPELASEQFLQAVDHGRAVGNDLLTIDALHMLGISEKGQKSLEWNLKAIAAAEQSQDERAKGWLGPLYNNNGWTLHDMGKLDRALELFEKCLAWHEERQTSKGLFIARWTVARCFRSLGRVDEAFVLQQELLAEIEAGKAEPDGFVQEELGELLLLKERPEEAKEYFAQAYAILKDVGWLVHGEPERMDRMAQLGAVTPSHRKEDNNE